MPKSQQIDGRSLKTDIWAASTNMFLDALVLKVGQQSRRSPEVVRFMTVQQTRDMIPLRGHIFQVTKLIIYKSQLWPKMNILQVTQVI
jgi:hypothetical protein